MIYNDGLKKPVVIPTLKAKKGGSKECIGCKAKEKELEAKDKELERFRKHVEELETRLHGAAKTPASRKIIRQKRVSQPILQSKGMKITTYFKIASTKQTIKQEESSASIHSSNVTSNRKREGSTEGKADHTKLRKKDVGKHQGKGLREA